MTDLGMIAGTPNSQADFINAKRQIMGGWFACDTSILDAFLWENGSMVDLNTLISPNSPFQLYWAPFIDDEGVIGAFGSLANGDSHTVLLIPCDENHPGVEGCDYSLVDAAAATRRSLGEQRPTDRRPFPITGSEDDQKAPTSRESNWQLEDKLTIFDRAEPATDSGSKTSGMELSRHRVAFV